jgi:hypothetical protein
MRLSLNKLYYKASSKLRSYKQPRRSAGSADISTWNFAVQPDLYGSSIDGVGAYTSVARLYSDSAIITGANSINGQSENNAGIVIDKKTDFANSVSANGVSLHSTGILVTDIVGGMMNWYGEGSQSGIKIDSIGQINNYYFYNYYSSTEIPGDLVIEGVGGNRGVDMGGVDESKYSSAISFSSRSYTNSVRLTGKATGVGGIGIYNTRLLNLDFVPRGIGEPYNRKIDSEVPVGNHSITGIATAAGGIGIYNSSDYFGTASGNDIITGIGGAAGGVGIYNLGTITTYQGNDTIDAITGGFGGGGKYKLDEGNDTVKGFGIGTFDGGPGDDSLYLPSGSYKVDRRGIAGEDYFITPSGTDKTMFIKDFEHLYIGTNSYGFPIRHSPTLTG